MHDTMTERCRQEISRRVHELFARSPMLADALDKLPFDRACFAGLDRDELQELAIDGLTSRELFHRSKPPWSPELPLDQATELKLRESHDHRLILVGCYAYSLRFTQWNYRSHPDLTSYCRGVLASAITPAALRNNESLRREFPPQKLVTADGLAFLPWCGDAHAING